MPEERPTHESHDKRSLRLRQRLHQATGDRDAEAEALADRTGDVSEEDALLAVHRAEGDLGPDEPAEKSDFATPEDAEAAKEDRSG